MATFEEVLHKAKSIAEAAGKKTGEVVEVTRLKLQAVGLGKDIENEMAELGRAIYNAQKTGSDVAEATEQSVAKIDALQDALDTVNDAIYSRRGMKRCKECSAVNADDADYCKRCGKPIA